MFRRVESLLFVFYGASPQTPSPRCAQFPAVLQPHVDFIGDLMGCKCLCIHLRSVTKPSLPLKEVPVRLRPVNSFRILILHIFFVRNLYVRVRKLLEEIRKTTGVTGRTDRCTAVTTGARPVCPTVILPYFWPYSSLKIPLP
jgi:hypothetical protein